jgi:hypothetical protein
MTRHPNIRHLNQHLIKREKWFRRFGDTMKTADGPLVFRDNGASILGVAHLDTVAWARPVYKGSTVWCPQLDDRLGAWVLCDVLPNMGIKFDLLLTTGEESGRSTASHFVPPRQYNWVFSFDRRGTDCVMYDYETEDRVDLLDGYGFQTGFGSFSDISALTHLGVAGFNFGVGYHGEHTYQCRADLGDTLRQAERFAAFYHGEKNTAQPWVPRPRKRSFVRFGFDWDDSWRFKRGNRRGGKVADKLHTYRACACCDAYVDEVELALCGSMLLCPDCVSDICGRCAGCGHTFPVVELYDSDNGLVCRDCLRDTPLGFYDAWEQYEGRD